MRSVGAETNLVYGFVITLDLIKSASDTPLASA